MLNFLTTPSYSSLLKRLTCGVTLSIIPVIGIATPTVSGNTLSWPDGDWYQVQHAGTYETVCEGSVASVASVSGGPCVIDTANYIVVNHSNGERFENITANDEPGAVSGVSVSGNRISWGDDGWYQVQNAETYLSVCEGGTECFVEPGVYLVVNHSTGERFTDIVVGIDFDTDDDDILERPLSVEISGNTIRWPDNGWYQVQDALSYASVCEGGTECEVSPGSYVLINHTSGERQALEVAGDEASSIDPESASVIVDVAITVPAYRSDALQVHLTWDEQRISADWVEDEFWLALVEFPANTDNLLTITFMDRNGDITLGSYEQVVSTGRTDAIALTISADQFDTERWDTDGDGISNIDELIADSDPLAVDELPALDDALNLIDVREDLLETFRTSQVDELAVMVDEVAHFVAQQTTRVWPNSDYYQVQLSDSDISVCEGGAQCTLVPGDYRVINHTTGERTSLQLPVVDTSSNPNATLLPSVPFDDYDELDFYNYPEHEWSVDTVDIEHASYNCEHGGNMVKESGAGTIVLDDSTIVGGIQRHGYFFDQCRMTIRGGSVLSDGEYLLNGSLRELYQNRPKPQIHNTFHDFSLQADNGLEYQVAGQTKVLSAISEIANSATIDEFRKKAPGSARWESISNLRTNNTAVNYFDISIDVSGTLNNETTAFQTVSISTLSPVTRSVYFNYSLREPLQGSIHFLAENGSELTLLANPMYDIERLSTPFFDIDYTTATGEQIIRSAVPTSLSVFKELSRGLSYCTVDRSTSPSRLQCTSGLFTRSF